jgi:tRNA(fMet)-specific endonuclease VapC
MYLLDTNHCSRILEGDRLVARRLLEKGDVLVATSVVARCELMFMAHHSQRKADNLARVSAFLSGIHVYSIDEVSADAYGELKTVLLQHFGPKPRSKRRKTTTGQLGFDENDLWVAAIALGRGLTVVSSDTGFIRVAQARQLSLESWWTPSSS